MKNNRLLRRLERKVLPHARIFKELPHLLLGEAMVRHPLGVELSEGHVRLEVQDEENTVGVETLGETLGCEEGVVEVMETGAYAGEVEVGKGGVCEP